MVACAVIRVCVAHQCSWLYIVIGVVCVITTHAHSEWYTSVCVYGRVIIVVVVVSYLS